MFCLILIPGDLTIKNLIRKDAMKYVLEVGFQGDEENSRKFVLRVERKGGFTLLHRVHNCGLPTGTGFEPNVVGNAISKRANSYGPVSTLSFLVSMPIPERGRWGEGMARWE